MKEKELNDDLGGRNQREGGGEKKIREVDHMSFSSSPSVFMSPRRKQGRGEGKKKGGAAKSDLLYSLFVIDDEGEGKKRGDRGKGRKREEKRKATWLSRSRRCPSEGRGGEKGGTREKGGEKGG